MFDFYWRFSERLAGALARRTSRYTDDQLWSMRQLGIDADELTDDQITQALADINGREYHRDADDYTPDRWADPDPYRAAAEADPNHWRNRFATLDEARDAANFAVWSAREYSFGPSTPPAWLDSFLADDEAEQESGWSL